MKTSEASQNFTSLHEVPQSGDG